METDHPDFEVLRRRLASHRLAVLATHGETYPYTSLVSVALTADARVLLFPTGRETRPGPRPEAAFNRARKN